MPAANLPFCVLCRAGGLHELFVLVLVEVVVVWSIIGNLICHPEQKDLSSGPLRSHLHVEILRLFVILGLSRQRPSLRPKSHLVQPGFMCGGEGGGWGVLSSPGKRILLAGGRTGLGPAAQSRGLPAVHPMSLPQLSRSLDPPSSLLVRSLLIEKAGCVLAAQVPRPEGGPGEPVRRLLGVHESACGQMR